MEEVCGGNAPIDSWRVENGGQEYRGRDRRRRAEFPCGEVRSGELWPRPE